MNTSPRILLPRNVQFKSPTFGDHSTVRQYFPKGTNLSTHTVEDLHDVARQLNSRPRKSLGWATPAERLRDLLEPI